MAETKEVNVGEVFPAIEDGGRGTPVEVRQEAKSNVIDSPKVNDVKDLIKNAEHEQYELTPEKLLDLLKGVDHINVDDGEAGTQYEGKVVVGLDEDLLQFILPFEVPLAKITHDVGESNTIITVDDGVFDADNGYHVTLEIEGTGADTGTHYGAGFDVLPFNNTQCFTAFNLLPPNAEEPVVGFASLDNAGQLIIDIPVVMTPESEQTIIHAKRII